MALLVFKITQQVNGGNPITRRVPFTPSTAGYEWSRVATLLRERFALQADEPLALIWKDNEGDLITISSQVEFQEVLDSLEGATTLRFEIAQPSSNFPAFSYAPSSVADSYIDDLPPPRFSPTNNATPLPFPPFSRGPLARQQSSTTATAPVGVGLSTLSPAESLIHLEDQFEQIEFFSEGSDTESEDGGSVSDTTDVQRVEGKGKERAAGDVAEWSGQRQDFGFVDDDSDEEEYTSLATATVGIDSIDASSPAVDEPAVEPHFHAEDPHDKPLPTSPPAPASDDPPEDALPFSSTPLPPTDDAEAPRTYAQQPPTTNSGLPPSLTAFLTSLPTHAEALSTNLTTFLNHPSSDTLSALLAVPSAPLGQIPTLARGIQSEVQAVVSELVGNVRKEAQGLQDEFAKIQREVGVEREKMRADSRRAEQETGGAGEKEDAEEKEAEPAAAAEPTAQEDVKVEEKPEEAASTPAAELNAIGESARLAAQKLEEAREEVRRVAREMRRKEREARKAKEHAARHSRRSSKASKVELKKAIKAASDETAPALDDPTASVEVPVVEAIRTPTTTATPFAGPTSDYVTRPEDDMYRRRISMPGSFLPPLNHPVNPGPFISRLPPALRQASTPPLTGSVQAATRSIPPRLHPLDSTSTPSSRPLSVPGSFPTTFNTSPNPPPQASTSTLPDDGEWAEVTPTQLKKQLAELGFDLKDVGTRGAAERVWEAKRGKSLGEMVDAVVEMLVKRTE